MKRSRSTYGKRCLCIALFSFALFPAISEAGPVEPEIRRLLTKLPHRETVASACVIDLSSGRAVVEENADTPLMPASTMKLFSMCAALEELGAPFKFETLLGTDGTNVIVLGDGDPGFGDEKIQTKRGESIIAPFERWAVAMQQAGITAVRGDLIVDESIFDEQRLHPSWERADLDNWYAAPVSGLNINDNCLDISVSPSKTANKGPTITMQPENRLARVSRGGGQGAPTLNHAFDSIEYKISGRTSKPWTFGPVSFPDPGLLFGDSLKTVLSRKGVHVNGVVRRARVRQPDGSIPPQVKIIAKHQTPLIECLARSGKDSQNLFAECLLKRAGYAWGRNQGVQDPRGSWKLGAHAVAATMGRLGVSTTGLVVADGSGLSRENRCTARQLAALLASGYPQSWGPVLQESLAVAGEDGSLRKRMKNSAGRIHAKTGTMRGIRTLAGYVESDSGPRYAFAIMFNGYKGGAAPYKAIQDQICRILLANATGQSTGAGAATLIGAAAP